MWLRYEEEVLGLDGEKGDDMWRRVIDNGNRLLAMR